MLEATCSRPCFSSILSAARARTRVLLSATLVGLVETAPKRKLARRLLQSRKKSLFQNQAIATHFTGKHTFKKAVCQRAALAVRRDEILGTRTHTDTCKMRC